MFHIVQPGTTPFWSLMSKLKLSVFWVFSKGTPHVRGSAYHQIGYESLVNLFLAKNNVLNKHQIPN